MARARPGERRQAILQTLARMLEERSGERITTAELARAVGVSEAALYRHFSGKARMFEALIEFIEESLFTRINRILSEEPDTRRRLGAIAFLVLGFAEKNPGMARILHGGVLTGETERLRRRVAQIYERLETQLRQVLREGELRDRRAYAVSDSAALLLALLEGRIAGYTRTGFQARPTAGWEAQWPLLSRGLFGEDGA
ncbi:MAG TPA: nucleoid occlusion factor SlmA [Burkholderiales bacterium]